MPKFLFLTRMLPIEIPKVDLQKWQTMLNKFIWSYRRHRISQKILRVSRNKGSVGVPDIHLYHEAAQLANALRILVMDAKTDWMLLEFGDHQTHTTMEMFWLPKHK